MEGFYQRVETSLLALSLALGLAVAGMATTPVALFGHRSTIVLPMVEVFGSDGAR